MKDIRTLQTSDPHAQIADSFEIVAVLKERAHGHHFSAKKEWVLLEIESENIISAFEDRFSVPLSLQNSLHNAVEVVIEMEETRSDGSAPVNQYWKEFSKLFQYYLENEMTPILVLLSTEASPLLFMRRSCLMFCVIEVFKTWFLGEDSDGYCKWFAGNSTFGGATGVSSFLFVYSLDYVCTRLANAVKAAKKGGER
ncbi:Mitochondrial carrier domain superfamily [Sesbania bispinosa]|nr:Mitochondrial carrier domain superfamily [Sesbania bispinosa]